MWHLNMDLNWWGVNVVVVILSCKNKFRSDGEDSFNVILLLDKLFLPAVWYGLKHRFEDRWALTVYRANLYNDFESRFINKTWPGQILATTFDDSWFHFFYTSNWNGRCLFESRKCTQIHLMSVRKENVYYRNLQRHFENKTFSAEHYPLKEG